MKVSKEITVRRMSTKMTRCQEFYDKVEKDGNFCGMSETAFRDLNHYIEEVEKDETGKPVISEGAWIKQ